MADVSDYHEYALGRYHAKVTLVVASLHELAVKVERHAQPMMNLKTMEPDYLRAAQAVLKEITWAMANMGVEELVGHANEVEKSRGA